MDIVKTIKNILDIIANIIIIIAASPFIAYFIFSGATVGLRVVSENEKNKNRKNKN